MPSLFTHFTIKSSWKLFWILNELHTSCSLSCILQILNTVALQSVCDVILDGTWKHGCVLVDEPYLFPQISCIDFMLIMRAIKNIARLYWIELFDKFNDSRLARATLSHECYIFSSLYFKRYSRKNNCFGSGIFEYHVLKLNSSGNWMIFSSRFIHQRSIV